MSGAIAAKVRDVSEQEDIELTSGTLDFIEMHTERVTQPRTVEFVKTSPPASADRSCRR